MFWAHRGTKGRHTHTNTEKESVPAPTHAPDIHTNKYELGLILDLSAVLEIQFNIIVFTLNKTPFIEHFKYIHSNLNFMDSCISILICFSVMKTFVR